MNTITVPVYGLNFAGCAPAIEKRLIAASGIVSTHASYVSQTATITYDDTQLSAEDVRTLVADCGFACGEPL
ncbi:MAG: heavy-metal-associated domain-containing protein, partial [Ktedonobacterales bacterium]